MAARAQHGRHKPNPTYPANLREFCRRLYEEGGQSAYQIRKGLLARGYDPCPSEHTIMCWVDEDHREARLISERRGGKRGPKRAKSWEARRDRLHELREKADLSASAAARVLNHDFGLQLSRWHVEAILRRRCGDRTARKLLTPGASA